MLINWVAAKTQQFLPGQDAEPDELSVNFDFALSAEMLGLLHAQNDDCMDAGGTSPRMRELASQEAIADAGDQAATATRFTLDEHELALA